MTPTFRCRACGHLDAADHAGECAHPHACRVCGAGVSFDPKTGAKKIDPENWEILADATPERLEELGVAEVARHEGKPPVASGRVVDAAMKDSPVTADNA